MTIRSEPQRTYDRTWIEIEEMLSKAELKLNYHQTAMQQYPTKSKEWVHDARQFKALQGVVKTLKWVLGDKSVDHPLV